MNPTTTTLDEARRLRNDAHHALVVAQLNLEKARARAREIKSKAGLRALEREVELRQHLYEGKAKLLNEVRDREAATPPTAPPTAPPRVREIILGDSK